jgi:shikimate kinase
VSSDNKTAKNQPQIIEIIGPAGAGKTTLVRALSQTNERFRSGFRLRRIEYLPLFVAKTFLLLPTVFLQSSNGMALSWREVKAMLYLEVLHPLLTRQASDRLSFILLDQGPVFKLTKLHKSGPESVKAQHFKRWWESTIQQWAFALHSLIWLDAPDAVLIERIHKRHKRHSAKGITLQEVYKFLDLYRTSYEQVISELRAKNGPKLLCFDTEKESLDQIVAKVLGALDRDRR